MGVVMVDPVDRKKKTVNESKKEIEKKKNTNLKARQVSDACQAPQLVCDSG